MSASTPKLTAKGGREAPRSTDKDLNASKRVCTHKTSDGTKKGYTGKMKYVVNYLRERMENVPLN